VETRSTDILVDVSLLFSCCDRQLKRYLTQMVLRALTCGEAVPPVGPLTPTAHQEEIM